jgi:hypothetical protein
MAMKPNPTVKVILDCGATAHMFYDRSFFSSYTCTTGYSVSVGDARNVPVGGYGCVRLRIKVPGGHHTMTLHGVMHVPKLAINLISLGALQSDGASYRSTKDGLLVMLGKDEILHAKLRNGLYYVDCIHADAAAAYEVSSGASLQTWHRRMGHLHLGVIRELARKEMVKGLTISSNDYDRVCEGCTMGKSHHLPLPK